MISILPLNATLQALPSGQIPAPTGTASFSSLLDGDAAQPVSTLEVPFQIDADVLGEKEPPVEQKDEVRLFTFTELGMFGRHHAQFMPTGKLDLDIGTQPEATSSVSITSPGKLNDAPLTGGKQALSISDTSLSLLQPANEISLGSREPPLVPIQRLAQGPAESDAEPASVEVEPSEASFAVNEVAVQKTMPSPVTAESFEVVPDEEALSPLEGGAQMPASSVDLKNPNPVPVNLAVLGSSDALVVSIRSPIEAGESMVRLRQAIGSLAAEFGMDVAELRINGSPLNQISPSAKGGSNGGRAG